MRPTFGETPLGLPELGSEMRAKPQNRSQTTSALTEGCCGWRQGHRRRRRDRGNRGGGRFLDDGAVAAAEFAAGELPDRSLVLDDVELALLRFFKAQGKTPL